MCVNICQKEVSLKLFLNHLSTQNEHIIDHDDVIISCKLNLSIFNFINLFAFFVSDTNYIKDMLRLQIKRVTIYFLIYDIVCSRVKYKKIRIIINFMNRSHQYKCMKSICSCQPLDFLFCTFCYHKVTNEVTFFILHYIEQRRQRILSKRGCSTL